MMWMLWPGPGMVARRPGCGVLSRRCFSAHGGRGVSVFFLFTSLGRSLTSSTSTGGAGAPGAPGDTWGQVQLHAGGAGTHPVRARLHPADCPGEDRSGVED